MPKLLPKKKSSKTTFKVNGILLCIVQDCCNITISEFQQLVDNARLKIVDSNISAK